MTERTAPAEGFINAPFSPEQVDALNRYQRLGHVHEFTCPEHHGDADRTLFASRDGWRCPHCNYTQNWAHAAMLHERPIDTIVTLPCDVMLPPATIIHKGCTYETLFTAFKARAKREPGDNRFADPVAALTRPAPHVPLSVRAVDYSYTGRLAGLAWKRSGLVRYVVEDENGRLFIHNAEQIGQSEGWTP